MGLDKLNNQPAKTRLLDPDQVSSYLTEQGIDILIGTSYVNYGYITGYFSHFGRDYPGPLYNVPWRPRTIAVNTDPIESLKLTLEQRELSNPTIGLDMSGLSINMVKKIQNSLPSTIS